MLMLLIELFLLAGVRCASGPVGWVANPNINAGQVVAVNELTPATYIAYNATIVKFQNYNFAGFTSVPRVVVSMIGYGQFQPTSPTQMLGFRFDITGLNRTSFNYTVNNYDVITFLLHYNYMAVQQEETTFYLAMEQLTFSPSDNPANSSAVQRYKLVEMAYPQNNSFSAYLAHQVTVIAFPVGFRMQAPSGLSLFSLNTSVLNSTHYSLNVSTVGNSVLWFIQFAVVSFDRTAIVANYTVYLDIILSRIVGNSSVNLGDNITNETYLYRNGLSGEVHVQFTLNGSQALPNYFYYNYSSTTNDLIVFRGFNYRLRSCPANLSFFDPSTLLCYDACPPSHFVETNLSLCLACHYSCLSCNASDNSSACSSCVSSDHRLLSNGNCLCEDNFYDNATKLCESCDQECLTCIDHSNSSCLSCNSSLFRVISGNNTCNCQSGYYENITCLPCSGRIAGCLSCSLSGLQLDCAACDSAAFLETNSDNSSCQCMSNYHYNGSACLLNSSVVGVCGDGSVTGQEQCDDGNTQSGDGCSGECLVEQGHTCTVNSSLSNSSICYYSEQMNFSLLTVQKQSGENKVMVKLRVDAPNCNLLTLKAYFESSDELRLYDHSRRLQSRELQAWISIPTKLIIFDTEGKILTIIFSYNASIDLSRKYLQLSSSASVSSSYMRYFYASPGSDVDLSVPFNNLPTSYYSQQQLSSVSVFYYIFLALVGLAWVLLILSVGLKRGAVGVENMLILEMTYLSLLDQPYILECMAGLQDAGKYLVGYNVAVMERVYYPGLLALGLDANVFNSCSLILCLMAAVFVIAGTLYIVKKCRGEGDAELEQSNSSERAKLSNKTDKSSGLELKEKSLSSKVLSYFLQTFMSISLLLAGILFAVISFSPSSALTANLALGTCYFMMCLLIWGIVIKQRNSQSFSCTSFLALLYPSTKVPCLLFSYGYYPSLLIFLSVAGPVMSLLRESPLVPLSLIIAFSIGVLVLVWTVGVYKDRLHRIRAGGNCIVLVLLMTSAILSNKFYEKLGVGVVVAALTVILLSVTLIGNVVVLVRVECNKKSKSAYSSEKEMQDMIDELGMANMAFLGDIGNRSYCHDRTDRLLGDHLSSLISEDDHPKFACKIEDKINELRNFKMSVVHPEAMVNEMINCEGFLDWDVDCPPSKPQQQDETKLISTPRQKVEGRMQEEKHSDEEMEAREIQNEVIPEQLPAQI